MWKIIVIQCYLYRNLSPACGITMNIKGDTSLILGGEAVPDTFLLLGDLHYYL